ncbi:MAG: hypothetical protein EP330_11555, partial [Deltaproteobacteria bacterium]
MNRRLLLRIAQILVTLAAFAWLSTRIEAAELVGALTGLPPLALLTATACWVTSFAIAVFRWRALMRAYGATAPIPLGWLFRVYWAGMFFNTWAPGGVGGDLVRGLAARRAFEGSAVGAATAGLAVTFVDRLIGLAGLMVLVGTSLSLWPVPGTE